MSWTDEKVAVLRQLWGSGKSASEIAEVIGGFSRNAVIGKAHRLGLSGKPAKAGTRPQPVAEPQSNGATIFNLTDRMCKWPIGDPKEAGFHFCGRPAMTGLPYCGEHAAVAYQPASSRRRDDEQKAVGA